MLTVPKLPVPVQARQVSFAAGSYFLHLTECRRRPAGSDEELAKTHPDHSSLSVQAPDRNALAHAAAGARSMVARRGRPPLTPCRDPAQMTRWTVAPARMAWGISATWSTTSSRLASSPAGGIGADFDRIADARRLPACGVDPAAAVTRTPFNPIPSAAASRYTSSRTQPAAARWSRCPPVKSASTVTPPGVHWCGKRTADPEADISV